ncbi:MULTISPECIES: antibiotic biosynthesis monooxygenase family protein [Rhodococcus]|jgi:heme-degrading monooxygenase HmoA|uniref:Antibiotic biosynthesis monooxygenase family protein n=1 Tax=Rhodococcus globerulus TaxID=33008 RepID=A0ABU4BVZ2_RHOGO|nr:MULTISPECIES: antibiotic biosynthesis monooxygenase family protein [Rhodococcus]MDV6268407.1 antibiotic biosynthesis monooxygenase family protein [Rhodococcus globerulus]MDV8067126.1 antibiotic biosynthesis monooxygenase family protein [Rhodococcus sp. IEGM 1366]NRI65511.1 antibiotic biosynthesis monooxygenase [Rhodococcus sp. MS16]
MIEEHAMLTVSAGSETEFEAAFHLAKPVMESAPGCLRADLLPSVDRKHTYLLRVRWETLESHTRTFPGTGQARECGRILQPFLAGPPRVTHYLTPITSG